jgi:hypothetical protein
MNKDFKYVPASKTNIAKTFARIRRELAQAEAEKKAAPKVQPIKPRKVAP